MNKYAISCVLITAVTLTMSLPLKAVSLITFPSTDIYATGISGDGNTVIGFTGDDVALWTQAAGVVVLGQVPGGIWSEANAVSFNGSVVVGQAYVGSGSDAFRWTQSTGMVALEPLSSDAAGVSDDGNVVAGNTSSGAFRWTQATGVVPLPNLEGGSSSNASNISGDGNVVVGKSPSASGDQAFRWTAATGMVGLGDLPGGGFWSEALAVSADGSVIVGASESDMTSEIYRWTEATGMVGLGDMNGALLESYATDVNADGSILVGIGKVGFGLPSIPLLWDTTNGFQDIQSLLTAAGIDLTNMALYWPKAISDDGKIILGEGWYKDTQMPFSWVADFSVPIPAAAWLFGSALLGLVGVARKKKTV